MKKNTALKIMLLVPFLAGVWSLAETASHDYEAWRKFFRRRERAEDSLALKAIHGNMGGAAWTTKKWTFTTAGPAFVTAAEWPGVTADAVPRVTGLDLSDNGLTGVLPDSIGILTELTTLNLSGNKITELSGDLVKLNKLTELDVSNNLLDSLPDLSSLGSLTKLDVSDNNSIPISSLERLVRSGLTLTYDKNDTLGTAFTIVKEVGDALDTTIAIDGQFNRYEILKDGKVYQAGSTTGNRLLFSDLSLFDTGYYQIKITNTKLTDLTYYYQKIRLIVNPCYISGNTISKSQTLCEGDTIPEFLGTVVTGGKDSIEYVWQSSFDSTNWSRAFTGQNYTPQSLTDTIMYRRVAQDGKCFPDTSNIITINVIKKLANNLIITAEQTVCKNDTVASLVGTEPTGGDGKHIFQWQSSPDDSTWTNLTQGRDFQPAGLSDTTYFRRLITGICSTDSSESVRVNIFPDPPSNTISYDQLICPGGNVLALKDTTVADTVIVDTKNFTFVWQKSTDKLTWSRADTVFNTDSLVQFTPRNVLTTTHFRRVVAGQCAGDTSNIVTVSMYGPIKNNVAETDVTTFCEGDTIKINLTGTEALGGGEEFTYTWQSSLDSLNWSDRFTTAGLTYTLDELTDTTYFRRIAKSKCYEDTGNVVKVNMVYKFGENIIGNSQIICAGSAPDTLIGNVQTGRGGFRFEWQSSVDSINWAKIDSAGNDQNYGTDSLGVGRTYFRRAALGGCLPNYSNVVYVNVAAPLTGNTIAGSQIVCEGDSVAKLLGTKVIGGGGQYVYNWESSTDSLNWVSGDTSEHLSPGKLNKTIYLRRIVRARQCEPDSSNVVKIQIINKITNNIIRDNKEMCLGEEADSLIGSQPEGGIGPDSAFVYIWQSSADNGTTWAGEASTKDYRPKDLKVPTQYRRVVLAGGCFADTSNVIEVNVIRKIKNNVITKGRQTVCRGAQPDTLFAALPVDGTGLFLYQWQKTIDSVWVNIADANTRNLRPSPADTTTTYRRIVANQCFSDTSSGIVISVLPLPDISAGLDTTVNIGLGIKLKASGGVRYVWQYDKSFAAGDSLSATPTVYPGVSTVYTVTGTDSRGCSNIAKVFVRVIDRPVVKAVDIITPNGDGLNETFYIQNMEVYPENTLVVINRWGQTVFETKDYKNSEGWDGTFNGASVPTGVYFYVLRFKITERVVKGSLTVINN